MYVYWAWIKHSYTLRNGFIGHTFTVVCAPEYILEMLEMEMIHCKMGCIIIITWGKLCLFRIALRSPFSFRFLQLT